jgi:hypothetical protein
MATEAASLARNFRTIGFEGESAELLAIDVEEWLRGAGEKIVLSITWLQGQASASDSLPAYSFACFIVYTE